MSPWLPEERQTRRRGGRSQASDHSEQYIWSEDVSRQPKSVDEMNTVKVIDALYNDTYILGHLIDELDSKNHNKV